MDSEEILDPSFLDENFNINDICSIIPYFSTQHIKSVGINRLNLLLLKEYTICNSETYILDGLLFYYADNPLSDNIQNFDQQFKELLHLINWKKIPLPYISTYFIPLELMNSEEFDKMRANFMAKERLYLYPDLEGLPQNSKTEEYIVKSECGDINSVRIILDRINDIQYLSEYSKLKGNIRLYRNLNDISFCPILIQIFNLCSIHEIYCKDVVIPLESLIDCVKYVDSDLFASFANVFITVCHNCDVKNWPVITLFLNRYFTSFIQHDKFTLLLSTVLEKDFDFFLGFPNLFFKLLEISSLQSQLSLLDLLHNYIREDISRRLYNTPDNIQFLINIYMHNQFLENIILNIFTTLSSHSAKCIKYLIKKVGWNILNDMYKIDSSSLSIPLTYAFVKDDEYMLLFHNNKEVLLSIWNYTSNLEKKKIAEIIKSQLTDQLTTEIHQYNFSTELLDSINTVN